MLCGTGTIAWAQDHDAGQSRTAHSDTARNQATGGIRASKLIGATVKNKAGDTIGEISDLVLSAGGNVTTAVVRAGGVLGIGDKKIAVPYKSFSVAPDGKTLSLDMTAEQLKSMPPYMDTSDEKGDHAQTSQNNTTNKFEHGTGAATSAAASSSAAAGAGAGGKSAHVLKATEQPASALIGAEVVDKGDAKVGKIKDVIVSTSGRGAQAVLAVGGGIANIGGRTIAVPLDNLTIQRGDHDPKHEPQRVQTNLTVSELAALPEFRYE